MRKFTTFLVAAAVLPAVAQTPGDALTSAIPTYQQFQAEVQGLSPDEIKALAARTVSPPAAQPPIYLHLSSRCYYIRQANKNLLKPKDDPEFVPLAESSAEPLNAANPNCLSDSIVRGAVPR